jgi:hypothetical protein
MPLKSKAQERWMWANDPEMAKRWEKETKNRKALPERVKPKTKLKKRGTQ